MKSKQTQLILVQLLTIFGFNYAMWTDTHLPNQNAITLSFITIILLFHLFMFSLMIFTLQEVEISKNKSFITQ